MTSNSRMTASEMVAPGISAKDMVGAVESLGQRIIGLEKMIAELQKRLERLENQPTNTPAPQIIHLEGNRFTTGTPIPPTGIIYTST